jgi:soluble lytic murein transglycosylase-like protein
MQNAIRAVITGGLIVCASPDVAAKDATAIVTSEARLQGVPVDFALHMARIESGVQCNNHNKRSTASGPLQITVPTARSLGFGGNIRKASCEQQARYGMMHLAICYKGARGNRSLAKRCHQQGVSALYGRKHGTYTGSRKRALGR